MSQRLPASVHSGPGRRDQPSPSESVPPSTGPARTTALATPAATAAGHHGATCQDPLCHHRSTRTGTTSYDPASPTVTRHHSTRQGDCTMPAGPSPRDLSRRPGPQRLGKPAAQPPGAQRQANAHPSAARRAHVTRQAARQRNAPGLDDYTRRRNAGRLRPSRHVIAYQVEATSQAVSMLPGPTRRDYPVRGTPGPLDRLGANLSSLRLSVSTHRRRAATIGIAPLDLWTTSESTTGRHGATTAGQALPSEVTATSHTRARSAEATVLAKTSRLPSDDT